ncbi:hypothetical protein Tco_1142781 [Tanacetum coccineum]
MLTGDIKKSKAHKAFIDYFTGLIPPKKIRGKWSKGKKAVVTPKKKSSISTDDSIILEPDVTLEFRKSIRQTETKITKEERRLHETHECLVTAKPTGMDESDESDGEPVNRPTGKRRPSGITLRDTSNVSKKKSLDQSQKLKGIQIMTEKEQLAADTKKAIKASKEALRLQQRTEDSSEGVGITPDIPDELTGKTLSEGAGIVLEVPDEGKGNDITWLSTDEEKKAKGNGDEEDDDRIEDYIVGTLVTMSQKEKPEVPRSSSSQSLSSNYDDMDKAAAAAYQSTQVKRKHDDKGEDPTAGSDQGKEKKRPRRDTQPSKKSSTSKESYKGKTSSKTSKPGKYVTEEEPDEEHVHDVSMDAEENIVDEIGNADEQPDGEASLKTDNARRNNWFKQPPRPLTPDPEWNTCQVVDDQPQQTWFNDLNRLKLDKITKADLVRSIYNLLKGTYQSSIKLEYNMEECFKDLSDRLDWTSPEGDKYPYDLSKPLSLKGHPGHLTIPTEHFFNNDLEYLKSENMERIQSKWVTIKMLLLEFHIGDLSVDKQFGYGYLEEIVVRRADRQLYTFKESDFINLHLNDIEDMLLLVVQHKLFHLDGDVIKKLIITKPQKDFPSISAKESYTPSFDPPGVVYEDLSNRKRLMRNFRLGYNKRMPNRKWSAKDQKRSGIMVELIEEHLLERRIMRNIERLVGARELEMDYMLMQRTV